MRVFTLRFLTALPLLVVAGCAGFWKPTPAPATEVKVLPDDEKRRYEETFTRDDGTWPEEIDAGAFNQWLFNAGTVDAVLRELMDRGQHTEGGDTLGKTIVFAKNHAHAQFIVDRFNALWPRYGGKFCRLIDNQVADADGLIREFGDKKRREFRLAVSVDMLDTGIDIPDVLNLVFFKRVPSKAKFWQMIGRGTRLCENLFAPPAAGDPAAYRQNPKHKQYFAIFDPCGNFEYFEQNPQTAESSPSPSLSARIFGTKLRLALALPADGAPDLAARREALLADLRADVQALDRTSVQVRAALPHVDAYADPAAWADLSATRVRELLRHVAPLVRYADTDESARRFDGLLYQTQLGLVTADAALPGLTERVRRLSKALLKKATVPAVAAKLPLLERAAGADYWQPPHLPDLEHLRREVRDLVQFLEAEARAMVYTSFADELESAGDRVYEPTVGYANLDVYRERMQHIVRANQHHLAIVRLRTNQPITPTDLAELSRMLVEGAELPSEDRLREALGEQPLGVFVRGIVGLDRAAAKAAFAGLLDCEPLTLQQQFLNTLIDSLCQNGVVDPGRLYESPFTDLNAAGLDGLLDDARADTIVSLLRQVEHNARLA